MCYYIMYINVYCDVHLFLFLACSSGSLVSKGKFVGLCLRFTDDFEASLDDWKPDMNDSNIMNLCVVSEGTYEVCSRTIAAKQGVGT